MRRVKNRIHITAGELDQIAKCPGSFNNLENIWQNRICHKCYVYSKLGQYVFQRAFRGGNQPSISTLTKRYKTILINDREFTEEHAGRLARKDAAVISDLLSLSSRLSGQIDSVGQHYELHFGGFTVEGEIDLIIYEEKLYSIVDFACSNYHPTFLFNYRALTSSLWLRENYNIEASAVARVTFGVDERPTMSTMIVNVSSDFMTNAILYALSRIQGPATTLPVVFGEHCLGCNLCF